MGQGEILAIALEGLDLGTLEDFAYATYASGKTWDEAAGTTNISLQDGARGGLISFLSEHLNGSVKGTVVMQNALWQRSTPHWDDPARLAYSLPTHHAFCKDEVYHVLTQQDTDWELMEETIREAETHWLAGVCADDMTIPNDNELSEEFLDELVRKTRHIFVSAFDGEGYLVWTPGGDSVLGGWMK